MSTIVNDLVSFLQCGGTIAIRDAIHIDSATGKVLKFDIADPTHVFAGLAKEAGVLNDYIRVVQSGRIKGFSGLTPGQFVYASTTVPGGFQLLEPASSQKVILGISKSATELIVNGALGIKPGGDGGGGGLDVFYTEDMEGLANTSDFSTGNNATFLGVGSLAGTLALEEVSPIAGAKSLIYTQASGSLNDYFASEIIDVDVKQKNNTSGMTLYFQYNGNANDGRFVVWDVTNNQRLSSEVSFVKVAGSATRYSLSFYVPSSCNQIRWGYQVLVQNIGAVLFVDDIEMSTNPFVISSIENDTDWEDAGYTTSDFTGFGTVTNIEIQTKRDGSDLLMRGKFTSGTPTAVEARVGLKFQNQALTSAGVLTIPSIQMAGYGHRTALATNQYGVLIEPSVTYFTFDAQGGNNGLTKINGNGLIESGNAFSFFARIPIAGWTTSTEHILTPSDTFSTDTAPLTYAGSAQFTLATLDNAPVGTFITYTYAANTNTRTQTNAAPPTQTTADMNQNGIQIFTRAFNAASIAASPTAFAIQIGKGLKGKSLDLYKSAGKVTSGDLDLSAVGTSDVGITAKNYSESTGILVVDAGWRMSGATTSVFLNFSDLSQQTSGYLTINAGRTLPLLAVPVPQVAYLKDVKPSGTAGGTFTAGAWQTRTLNTVEGDGSIVSLSANQFTLGPGRYEIEASAPAYRTSLNKAKLRNITDSLDTIIGQNSYNGSAIENSSNALVVGSFTVSSSKTFELQHRCTSTRVTDGFGPSTGYGVDEVYAQVKIVKKA